jgi:hypothetical protein
MGAGMLAVPLKDRQANTRTPSIEGCSCAFANVAAHCSPMFACSLFRNETINKRSWLVIAPAREAESLERTSKRKRGACLAVNPTGTTLADEAEGHQFA